MTESAAARAPREPATLSTVEAWRRTGLVLCSIAVACFVGGLAAVAGGPDVVTALAFLLALVTVLIGFGYLQRAWSDPLVAADPTVGRMQRLGQAASLGWGLTLLVRLVALLLPDGADWLRWVAVPVAAVAVVSFLAVLVLVARWRPGRV